MNINEFMKLLGKLAYRHSSYADCYSDFLDWSIGCFLVDGDKPCAERLQAKYKDDYKYFKLLFAELINIYNTKICPVIPTEDPNDMYKNNESSWCDPLGNVYMEISSKFKASGLGQFFTPEHMCTFMAALMISNDSGPSKLIGEPCSGSGRMILAANSWCLGNYYSAVDLDPMCTKMTALNMCIHGVKGQVNCGNSLYIGQDWRFGYEVNYHLDWSGIPTLLPLEREQSLEIKMFTSMISERIEEKVNKPNIIIPTVNNIPNYVERSLF